MGTLYTLLAIAAVLIVSALIAKALAYLLTEVYKLPIKRKPFNCYGCLSFWFTLVFGLVVAFVVRRYFEQPEAKAVVTLTTTAQAFTLGIINYLLIKIKYRVYE